MLHNERAAEPIDVVPGDALRRFNVALHPTLSLFRRYICIRSAYSAPFTYCKEHFPRSHRWGNIVP